MHQEVIEELEAKCERLYQAMQDGEAKQAEMRSQGAAVETLIIDTSVHLAQVSRWLSGWGHVRALLGSLGVGCTATLCCPSQSLFSELRDALPLALALALALAPMGPNPNPNLTLTLTCRSCSRLERLS